MTINQLIAHLEHYPPDTPVMYGDDDVDFRYSGFANVVQVYGVEINGKQAVVLS